MTSYVKVADIYNTPIQSDVVEITEDEMGRNYRTSFISNNGYGIDKKSRTPGQKRYYAGVAENRRNYKLFISGEGTIPGEQEKVRYKVKNYKVNNVCKTCTCCCACTCTCSPCTCCLKIKRYQVCGSGCCCSCRCHVCTVPVRTTAIRYRSPIKTRKIVKVIDAVPVRLTEYANAECDQGYVYEKDVCSSGVQKCAYCGSIIAKTAYSGCNCCCKCACRVYKCPKVIGGTRYISSIRQPEYLNNYTCHQIRCRSPCMKKSRSYAKYYCY